jgi:hypothetical protein
MAKLKDIRAKKAVKKSVKKAVKKAVKKKASSVGARGEKSGTFSLTLPGVADISQPPKRLLEYCILIYGQKGIGKTSASSSFPNYVNFCLEPFRENIKIRKQDFVFKESEELQELVDYNDPDSMIEHDPWSQMVYLGYEAVERGDTDGITFDSVDVAYSACQEHICARYGVKSCFAKVPNVNLWDELRITFTKYIQYLRQNKIGVLFLSHAKEREMELMEGTQALTMIGPSCPPACGKIMKQVCDFWFYYGWDDGNRCLYMHDPSRELEVASGIGFRNEDGTQMEKLQIPNDASKFYSTLNGAFDIERGMNPTAKKPVKRTVKKAVKKTVKRKAR